MNDSLNICLPCGLCCDGTLIGFVQIDNDEVPALRKIMEIEEEKNNGFFLHPCKKHCDGVCSVYSKRPKQCDKFNCGLIKSLEQKELDFDSAIKTIDSVRQKKIAIVKNISELQFNLKSKSFYFKIVELNRLLQKKKAEAALTKKELKLMSDLDQFNKLISEKFGIPLY